MILYSAYIPSYDKLYILKEFLDICLETFKNEKIYIGFQLNTIHEVITLCNQYNLNLVYDFSTENIYVDSDVPGFQTALRLYSEDTSKDNSSFVYFGHTKGVTTAVDSARHFFYKIFFKEREIVENKLMLDDKYGCYGFWLSPIIVKPISDEYKSYSDILLAWNKTLKYSVLNYFYTNTFYTIKRNILDTFLSNLDKAFYETNLKDRYFFERDFIHCVDMQGFEPLFERLSWNNSWITPNMSIEEYSNMLTKWKEIHA